MESPLNILQTKNNSFVGWEGCLDSIFEVYLKTKIT